MSNYCLEVQEDTFLLELQVIRFSWAMIDDTCVIDCKAIFVLCFSVNTGRNVISSER